jgi:type VI secretion system secreted protein VgrG
VVINFLEGDPDRPIITGCLYHGTNRPPYKLPDEKTKSTVKSNSSTGGGGFNEIRIDDKKGDEQLFIHAEKNFDLRIKNDRFETVGRDRNLVVENDKKEHVKNERHEMVDSHHYEKIGGDLHLKVVGKEAVGVDDSLSLTVQGDVIEVFKANNSRQVTNDFYVKADNIVIEAMTNITIKVGQSYVAIEAGGIKIGTMGTLELESSGQLSAKGTAGLKLETPATAEMQGSMTTVKANGVLTVQGAMVKIN